MLGSIGATPALLAYVYTGSLSGMALMSLTGNNIELNSIQLTTIIVGFIATVAGLCYFANIARKAVVSQQN